MSAQQELSTSTMSFAQAIEVIAKNSTAVQAILPELLRIHMERQVRWYLLYDGELLDYQVAANANEHNLFVEQAGPSVRGSTHAVQLANTMLELASYAHPPDGLNIAPIELLLITIARGHDLGETPTPPNGLTPVGDVPGFEKADDPSIQEQETKIVQAIFQNEANDGNITLETANALFTLYKAIVDKSTKPQDSSEERHLIDYLESIFDIAEILDYLSTGLHTINYLAEHTKSDSEHPLHLRNLAIIATLSSLKKLIDKAGSSPELLAYLRTHQNEILFALEFLKRFENRSPDEWQYTILRGKEAKEMQDSFPIVRNGFFKLVNKNTGAHLEINRNHQKEQLLTLAENLRIRQILSRLEKPQHLSKEARLKLINELLEYFERVRFPNIDRSVAEKSYELALAATRTLEDFKSTFPIKPSSILQTAHDYLRLAHTTLHSWLSATA